MNGLEIGFFSIPVSNLNKAKDFYGSLMNWNFKERDSNFLYVFSNEQMIGSLEQSSNEFKSSEHGPLMYFRAESMNAITAKAKEIGGTIKTNIAINDGENGYTSQIIDPFGNKIAFWSPEK